MKPLFLLLLGLVLHPARAQMYLPDTLRIQRLATSYLLFPDAITLVDISPEYQVKIEAQTLLFVRPRLIQARPTPLLVRTRQQTYLGYLATAPGASPAFVDIATLLPPPATPPPAGTLPPAEAGPPPGWTPCCPHRRDGGAPWESAGTAASVCS